MLEYGLQIRQIAFHANVWMVRDNAIRYVRRDALSRKNSLLTKTMMNVVFAELVSINYDVNKISMVQTPCD